LPRSLRPRPRPRGTSSSTVRFHTRFRRRRTRPERRPPSREAALASGGRTRAAPALTFPSTDEAAAYIEKRLAEGTATWTPARDTDDFEAVKSARLFKRTPKSWQQLAPLLPLDVAVDGATEQDDGFDFALAEPEWNDWLGSDEDPEEPDEAPSTDDLVIGRTPFGDWYSFRKTDPALPADARITHWDHETTLPADQWPTVAAFAAAIIEAADRAAASTGG
jgi:hypothetical protein